MPSVVFTNGVFDLVHNGHIHLLREARALGDRLVVGLNSDASVRRLKGQNRPVNCEQDRAEVLRAIRYVDAVEIFDTEADLERLVERIRPSVLAKGADYRGLAVTGTYFAGRVEFIELLPGHSTTATIERLCKS